MSSSESPAVPPPVPVTVALTPDTPMRLARLRPEFASLYAGLDAGTWYPAASVAAYFTAWLVRHPDRQGGGEPLRGLETAHFDFRGGEPREPPWLPGQVPDARRRPSTG